MHVAAKGGKIQQMIALLRRWPLVSFFVLAFAWTWAFVIVFLILFSLPDILVRTTPGDRGPLIAAVDKPALAAQPAYSAP